MEHAPGDFVPEIGVLSLCSSILFFTGGHREAQSPGCVRSLLTMHLSSRKRCRMTRELKEAVWARAGGRCEVVWDGVRCAHRCRRANWEAHVHHLVYRGHERERLADLELRCLACHQRRHPHHTFLTKAQQQARRAGVSLKKVLGAAAVPRPRALSPRARRKALRAGLTRGERRALRHGAGTWAWRPPTPESEVPRA